MNARTSSSVGVICFWDRPAVPYLRKYEDLLREAEATYDILFWERSGRGPAPGPSNEVPINVRASHRLLPKVLSFLRWKRAAIRILRSRSYDYLIVLSTMPAVLLGPYLKRRYRGRFIFDIRDHSFESFVPYRRYVQSLVRASEFTTISSRGFFRWLDPSPKIIVNHNMTHSRPARLRERCFPDPERVRIGFVGNIRSDLQTEGLLLNLRESRRYSFLFIGRMLPGCDLPEFCRRNGIRNVSFEGPFSHEDKESRYLAVDLVNAIYGTRRSAPRPADSTPLPNRVYDAAVFRCPILAPDGTYLAEVVRSNGLGLVLDPFAGPLEPVLDDYLGRFDQAGFFTRCEAFLSDVAREEGAFRDRVRRSLGRVTAAG